MSRTGWKKREREAAQLVNGQRFPANTGGGIDVESSRYVVQVKARKMFSLKQLEEAVVEIDRLAAQKGKLGLVTLKRSAGYGVETPWLVVVSKYTWRELHGELPVTLIGAKES